MPLKFYVSTFYADGSPARCKVNVTLANDSSKKSLATLRSNRYGLAKVSGVRLPREFENDRNVNLVVSAVDSRGQTGSKTEQLSFDDDETILVETDKSLYRAGEPIVAFIRSSNPRQTVVVDLARDSSVIGSERVQLHDGRSSVTFPYKPEFKDKLTIAAYGDFSESRRMIDTRAVLYPRNPDLKVNVRTSQASYRPGDDAQVNLKVRAPEGGSAESALGVVVLDKAVEERFRTDQEFGQRSSTFNDSMQRFLGLDQQIAGVTLRDLQRLDMTKPVSPDLDLLAEVLLNQTRDYFPDLHTSDQYETNQLNVFSDAIRNQLEPLRNALVTKYVRDSDYPKDGASLRRLLSEFKIAPDTLRDPWGTAYQAAFFIDSQSDVLTLVSAGADKRFETDDDFSVERAGWPYFRPLGEAIDKAVRRYHETTGGFIRDFATLKDELAKDSLDLNSLRDRWGHPYRFEFEVRQTDFSINISSAGPDQKFSSNESYSGDDFVIWRSAIDYFVERLPSRVVLSATSGAIAGVVTDANGAAIPQTTVTATQSPRGQSYSCSTDDDGRYSFGSLPPGLYEVRFEARGFTIMVFTNVLVNAFNLTQLNATLQVGVVTDTVTVTGGGLENNMTEMSVNASRSSLPRTAKAQDISTPRLREYFPETLVWQPSIETDKQGRAKISFKLADNITTWKLAVIGSTEDGSIGTTETEIKAFQPFFVEHDPPRVLTEGDEISLPVVVRNYLERPQNVDLEIKPESWFTLLAPARKRTAVAAGDARRETFELRASAAVDDGKQRITATGGEVSDAIEKPVTVHPDGKEMSITAGDILSASAELQLDLPETMIPNSRRAELKIYPNLMAHVIESVEAIMKRPYGCGEQTISSTYPSLLLLRRHKQSGDDFPLRARAQRYLNDGYSRLLNYRDESGGFTYWGRGEPDVALTAYALRFLTEAADVIAVDEEVIKQAREWLIKQQRSDGSWAEHEYGNNRDDILRSAVLTAYVTRILTMSDRRGEEVKRALDYLDKPASQGD